MAQSQEQISTILKVYKTHWVIVNTRIECQNSQMILGIQR